MVLGLKEIFYLEYKIKKYNDKSLLIRIKIVIDPY